MSGYPDWQGLQQWNGSPLDTKSAYALGGGNYDSGVLQVGSWASVLVWVKATAKPVTVTATQTIGAGPAALTLVRSWTVAAGQQIITPIILDADQVDIVLTGGGAGCVVDYAVVPSNTSTATAPVASGQVTQLTGIFDGAGGIIGGTGFTVTRTAVGKYDVVYTTAFPAVPVVVCQPYDSAFNPYFPLLFARTAAGFSVCNINSAGALRDQEIEFLATLTV